MKFRLKLLWLELNIETPAPEQVSTTDMVTAIWSAIAQNPMYRVLVTEDTDEAD